MASTEQSANDALGPGALHTPNRFFTPVAFGEGTSLKSRFSSLVDTAQREESISGLLAGAAQNRLSLADSDRKVAAMAQENDVLESLQSLDPMSPDFENSASQFSQMASISPAVNKALQLKINQRVGMNSSLDTMAEAATQAGLGANSFNETMTTAAELLRNRDLTGFRRKLSIVGSLAASNKMAASRAHATSQKHAEAMLKLGETAPQRFRDDEKLAFFFEPGPSRVSDEAQTGALVAMAEDLTSEAILGTATAITNRDGDGNLLEDEEGNQIEQMILKRKGLSKLEDTVALMNTPDGKGALAEYIEEMSQTALDHDKDFFVSKYAEVIKGGKSTSISDGERGTISIHSGESPEALENRALVNFVGGLYDRINDLKKIRNERRRFQTALPQGTNFSGTREKSGAKGKNRVSVRDRNAIASHMITNALDGI